MLQHVSIETRREDADVCVRFYELVGFERVEPPPSLAGRAAWVERAGTQVHLLFADDPVVPPSGHHAVVAEDYEATLARIRDAGVEVELADGELAFRARQQIEAWLTWVTKRRPFVTYKAAATLDGRLTLPGSRWISGEASRRLVHELRARSDAVAVGMGTVRADNPALTARGVGAARQPRRLAFGRGPLPDGSSLVLVGGPLDEALARLAREGVQSLLLEGGPTLATAFLEGDLVDKVLVFVAPRLAGSGPRLLGGLSRSVPLHRLRAERLGDDVVLSAYAHEP
jgi:diaminohydroxyphosphoribosylaminopyrimidine deaminase/5-amino-6-(5-phosphoribosylamino)uracil reductase